MTARLRTWGREENSSFSLKLPRQESTLAPPDVYTNKDTDPSTPEQRNWGPMSWILYWSSDIFQVSGWQKYSSMISLGLDWRNAFGAATVGSLILAVPLILNGKIGAVNRVPFPIAVRASHGYRFAWFVIFSRAVIALFWFGIQSYNGATSCRVMLGAIWPSFSKLPNEIPASQGVTSQQMIAYFVFWVVQFPLLFVHPTKLRPLFLVKIILVPISAFAILGWCVHQAHQLPGGMGTLLKAGPTAKGSAFDAAWVYCMNSVVSGYATLAVNIPDFSRYSTTHSAQYVVAPFLPVAHLVLASISVVCASATKAIAGKVLWTPLDIIALWDSRAARFFAALPWFIAQISVNVSSNSVSAANDIATLCPKYLDIVRAQVLVGVPWKILASSNTFYAFISGYALVLGPFAGIMVSDYYFVKKQKLNVPELYSPRGIYRYNSWGTNWRAMVAFIVACAPNMPGLVNKMNSKIKIGNAAYLYDASWLVGFSLSVLVYTVLSLMFPDMSGSIVEHAVHPDDFLAERDANHAGSSGSGSIGEEDKKSSDGANILRFSGDYTSLSSIRLESPGDKYAEEASFIVKDYDATPPNGNVEKLHIPAYVPRWPRGIGLQPLLLAVVVATFGVTALLAVQGGSIWPGSGPEQSAGYNQRQGSWSESEKEIRRYPGWGYHKPHESLMKMVDQLSKTLPLNSATKKFAGNRGTVLRLFRQARSAPMMYDLGLTPDSAYSCIVDYLIRPKADVLRFIAPYTAFFELPEIYTISIQIRTGDESMQLPETDVVNSVEKYRHFFHCADQVALTRARKDQRVVYFLLSDSEHLKAEALAKWPDRIVTTGLGASHRLDDQVTKDVYAVADSLQTAVADSWTQEAADFLIITKASGFGKIQSYRRGVPGTTIGLTAAGDWPDCTNPNSYATTTGLSNGCACILTEFLSGLDQTIVAAASASVANNLHSLTSVGWFGSAYLLTSASLQPTFGRLYMFFPIRVVLCGCLATFQVASVICAVARSAPVFIVGHAGIFIGVLGIGSATLPVHLQAIYTSFTVAAYGLGSSTGPLIGGVIATKLNWRVAQVVFIIFCYLPGRKESQGILDRLKQVDWLGPIVLLMSCMCILMVLQDGGVNYSWNSGRIIGLIVASGVLFIAFFVLQAYLKERASVVIRVMRQRNIALLIVYNICSGGTWFAVLYLLPTYFQAVRGSSALRSGVQLLPTILPSVISGILGGWTVSHFLSFYREVISGMALTAVGAGLLSTMNTTTSMGKWAYVASQAFASPEDRPAAASLVIFFQLIGATLWVSLTEAIYQNRFLRGLEQIQGLDASAVIDSGVSAFRDVTMKGSLALVGALAAVSVQALPTVDTTYPSIPVGDLQDQTVQGNGKGFPRLIEAPAVAPSSSNPTNNINVISLGYIPTGMNIHFQTAQGLGKKPEVLWGESPSKLTNRAFGLTKWYDRTPPCSLANVTQCSEYFHDVQIVGLEAGKEYYYQIPGGNGTTPSDVNKFKTARKAGQAGEFSVAIINDMGYTNAKGTHKQLLNVIEEGAAFVWHGGDISYADDWYEGLLYCDLNTTSPGYWEVCYNGTSSTVPGGVTPEYAVPLPAGEHPEQGGPNGGDISVIYESNWDLWQQWMSPITTKVPHMVAPGNHEAACAEFDGEYNELTAYFDGLNTTTAPESDLNYYSCPESQRNFTAYQNRFRMPGVETGGVGNFWYSHDYGLVHFITFNGETDYPSPNEYPFALDLTGNETHPLANETYITDAGPFGFINGSLKDVENYEQYQWLKADLAAVDRFKTPFVFAMSHRPMYSSGVSSYQAHMRSAFEALFLEYNVDAYISGHIHWYERTFPMGFNGTIDNSAIINNNTFLAHNGSMLHIINGQAGNIESHSTLYADESILPLTAFLNTDTYGFTKLLVYNETMAKFEFIEGPDGKVGDYVYIIKQ
ncbi:hypothetical protein MNV49_004091 [Pseudohyphozyma bogoriensis]|nr:hypothetical protein MNV49_004091 [Pseudohyphozyma bogoriensis]